MPYNPIPTKSPNDSIGSAGWNNYIRDNIHFLHDQGVARHGCFLRRNLSSLVLTSTPYQIPWTVEQEDTDGFHSTASNIERIVIPGGLAGVYSITGYFRFDDVAPTTPTLVLQKNGLALSRTLGPAVAYSSITVTWAGYLAVGDYITLAVYHESGNISVDAVNTANSIDPMSPSIHCYKT